jgi:hypothetical protein
VVTATVLAGNADSFFYSAVKGEGAFLVFGQYELVKPLLQAFTQLALVWGFALHGMLWSAAAMHGFGLLFLLWRGPRIPVGLAWDWVRTVALLRTGLPMYLNKILDSVLGSVALVIAAPHLSTGEFGILGFAIGALALTKVPFAHILSLTFSRQMAVEAGRSGPDNYAAYRRYLERPFLLYLLLLSAGLGVLVLFYALTIDYYLTAFKPALPVMVALYAAFGLYNARVFLYAYINATGQMALRSRILVVGIVTMAGTVWGALALGVGLLGVALALGATMLWVGGHAVWVCVAQVTGRRSAGVSMLARLSLCTAILTVTLVALLALPGSAAGQAPRLWSLAAAFVGKGVVFSLTSVWVYGVVFRGFGLWPEVRRVTVDAGARIRHHVQRSLPLGNAG